MNLKPKQTKRTLQDLEQALTEARAKIKEHLAIRPDSLDVVARGKWAEYHELLEERLNRAEEASKREQESLALTAPKLNTVPEDKQKEQKKRTSHVQARVLDFQDVADYLGCHRSHVYRLMKDAGLPAVRLGHRWVFLKDQVDAWLESKPAVNQGGSHGHE
jgi:excisionase family DNA binding protein